MEHPILCGTSIFLLFVYLFLPSLFYFSLYSFPILVIVAVAVKFALDHRQPIKQEEQVNIQTTLDAGIKPLVRAHSVRRRKEQQKDMVSTPTTAATIPNNDIIIDKGTLIEDNPKDIREVKVDDNVTKRMLKEKKGYRDGRSSDEDQEEEEESKALEWTEDDQKNLTDLGLSEIERNKRLESLIAKRMARKLLSIQVRKTLMNMGNNKSPHVPSILIPKPSIDSQISPIPNSAPSVLLPTHNPFDLPYDSHEEKPNLTGDGFQEQPANQPPKDLTLCRHVSFSPGVHFPCPEEFDKDRSIPEFSRLRKESPRISGTPRFSKIEQRGNGEGFFYTNKSVIHMPRDSIDSDMDVEISETASHLDLDTLGLDDELGTGKPWAASSHLAGVEENESKSREVHEVTEKDVIAVGFARLSPICDEHISSNHIDEHNLQQKPPILHSMDDVLAESSGSNSNSTSMEEERNITNDAPATNNDKDILNFIKQTYGEEGSNGHPSAPNNDENQTNVSSDENNELTNQNWINPFADLSDLNVHTNIRDTESKEQPETMVEDGPSDSSSCSSPKSSSTMKKENANGGEEQLGVQQRVLHTSDDEAGSSIPVQEADTGPPLRNSSPSPKSVLQKKYSLASISSSDQINIETPQHEDEIQTVHEPSANIETRETPLEESMEDEEDRSKEMKEVKTDDINVINGS